VTRVVAIANQKGGVGKTTAAINLSASLAHYGFDTLLIDLDPQCNATSGLGLTRELTALHTYHVLQSIVPLESTILETGVEHLYIAPSHIDLYGLEIEIVGMENREGRLKAAIRQMEREFEFIFIDCPPSLNLLTINAFSAADAVLIPMPCEYYALEGLSLLVKTIEQVQSAINPRLVLEGILINMYDGRANLAQQVHAEVKKYFSEKIFDTIIPRNVRLAEAPGFGKPAFQYDQSSTGAVAFLRLAREYAQRMGLEISEPLLEEKSPAHRPRKGMTPDLKEEHREDLSEKSLTQEIDLRSEPLEDSPGTSSPATIVPFSEAPAKGDVVFPEKADSETREEVEEGSIMTTQKGGEPIENLFAKDAPDALVKDIPSSEEDPSPKVYDLEEEVTDLYDPHYKGEGQRPPQWNSQADLPVIETKESSENTASEIERKSDDSLSGDSAPSRKSTEDIDLK